jgi:hypothetical protein
LQLHHFDVPPLKDGAPDTYVNLGIRIDKLRAASQADIAAATRQASVSRAQTARHDATGKAGLDWTQSSLEANAELATQTQVLHALRQPWTMGVHGLEA